VPIEGDALGTLTYDSAVTVTFDDRMLAHLQVVVWAKLRRGEQFSFTWAEGQPAEQARTSVWIAPSIPLAFRYDGTDVPEIDQRWIDALMRAANSAGGLRPLPQPEAER